MKAAHFQARGPARDVLQVVSDFPQPTPLSGQVRVRIVASGVNPSDVKGRGIRRGNSTMEWPRVVPHQDGAGVIDAVGAGVPSERVGQRVWLYMAQIDQAFGTAAEWAVVPADRAVPLPTQASFDEGAMLGVPAMTAHYALVDHGPGVIGSTVLVHGGAGAVGFYALQVARLAGAKHVIATVSNDAQADEARRAGAHLVLNRHRDDVVQAVRALGGSDHPVHRVVDVAFGANQDVNLALLATGGVIAAYSSDEIPTPQLKFWDHLARDLTLRMLLIYAAPPRALQRAAVGLSQWIQEGLLVHPRAFVYPLEDIAAAHEALEERRHIGKVIVRLPEA